MFLTVTIKEIYILPETTISQAQPAIIWSSLAVLSVE